jgi:tetratricopeptide (TPR) repeat protein
MDDRLRQLLARAREHYDRNELDRAAHALTQVLELSDEHADVHHMMGMILHGRGEFLRARAHFERAVALNPAYTEASLSLVVCLNDLGEYERAKEIHQRVRELARPTGETRVRDPYALGRLANLHAELADAYAQSGYPEEAAAELEKAVHLRPGFADLWVRLGALRRELGQLESASEAFLAACEARPDFAPARVQLGIVLALLGQNLEAKCALLEALQLEPANKLAKLHLRLVEERLAEEHAGSKGSAGEP